MKPPLRQGSPNDFQTPAWCLEPLYPHLPRVIWECAAGKGNLVNALTTKGYQVIGTDVLTGTDFLTATPPAFDCIVTNPPYSLKDEFLSRAYKLQKPFAFLLPLTTFEGIARQELFRKHGVQVIFLPKRVKFETPSGHGSGSWFATAWFTYGLNLSKDMNFWK